MPTIKPNTIFLKLTTVEEIEFNWKVKLPRKYYGDVYRKPKIYIKTSKVGNIHWNNPQTSIFIDIELAKLKRPFKILKT